jgi:ubiquitin C-terminal hydrolase
MRKRDDSIMTDLFEGQLMSAVTCLKCNYKSATFDNFMDLSIEIPRKAVKFTGSMSINDCLKTFFSTERMIDCGYKCGGCKKEVSIEKGMSVYRFPKILVIHLKRFYHSMMRKEKISSTVQLAENCLDMR